MTCPACVALQIDYDKALSNTTIAAIGNIFSVTAVTELLRLTVPSLPVPVWIGAQFVFQNATAGSSNFDVNFVIGPATAGVLAAAAALDSHGGLNVGGSSAESVGRKLFVNYRLPADSPGDYIIGAWRDTGSDTGAALGNSVIPGQAWAHR